MACPRPRGDVPGAFLVTMVGEANEVLRSRRRIPAAAHDSRVSETRTTGSPGLDRGHARKASARIATWMMPRATGLITPGSSTVDEERNHIVMLTRLTKLPEQQPSPWIPAVHLLLDGFSKTAIGVGLLLGHLATVIERHSASLPRHDGRAAVTWLQAITE